MNGSAPSLGGPLALRDEGVFFVGGETLRTEYARLPPGGPRPGHIQVGQMYVHYRIPSAVAEPPVVLIHGGCHSGAAWETTPDGREGWATYFTRRGFPVYVVDHAGRGRSGFDPSAINRALARDSVDGLPEVATISVEHLWSSFRLGPAYPAFHPATQFPVEALDHYLAQVVPNTEVTLPAKAASTTKALRMLLARIGPAILIVHSQSAAFGIDVVRTDPEKIRALISIEGECTTATAEDVGAAFRHVPLLSLFGDHSVDAPGPNGNARREGWRAIVRAVERIGGSATALVLPEAGVQGNSHLMILERNNRDIADLVIDWIRDSAGA